MDAYTTVYRHLLLPLWEGARRRPTLERLAYLERTQWRPPEELAAQQVGRLRHLLRHAYEHAPGWRRRMDAAGFDPRTLRDVGDLARLPLLSRDEARAGSKDFVAQGGPFGGGAALIEKSTSGTTGQPFRFRYNYDSEVWRQAVKLRAYAWAGWVPGVRTVHYWGPAAAPPPKKKALKIALDRGLRRETYLDCAKQSEADLRAAAAELRRLRPACLVGFTQATVQFARFVVRERLRDWPAMKVLCGAERLFPEDRPILEEAFGERGSVFETYGCREFMLIASECEAHEGLHVSQENLVVEVVGDDGKPVAPGQVGQIAVTDLHNLGMPLVRYVTGDLAVAGEPPSASSRCPCGRGLARIAQIEGRQQDLLRGPGGRGIPGIIFNAIIAGLGGKVDQFQAIQRKDGHIDLYLVAGPDYDDQVLEGLRGRLQPYLDGVPLQMTLVPSIPPLSSGKRRYVVVEQ